MADFSACGLAPPNPHCDASSQHYGRCPNASAGRIQRWGRVIGGVLPSELNRFFFTQQSTGLWLIASPTARYPPILWRRWRQFGGVAASAAAAARRKTRRQHCVDEHAKLKTQLKTKQPSQPRATSSDIDNIPLVGAGKTIPREYRVTWGPTQVTWIPDWYDSTGTRE